MGIPVTPYALRDAELIRLQGELLDYTGHVHRGTKRGDALALVGCINQIRDELGWRRLDMTGRWRRVG
jgi:hypothetical protein